MRRIDDFLIDRVFQPVADRAGRWASCYAIAAFLLTGAMLAHFGIEVYRQEWVMMFMSATWLPYRVVRAYQMDAAPPSTALPVERARYCFTRSVFFCVNLSVAPLDIQHYLNGEYLRLLQSAIWWVILASFYFMACRKNPPPARREAFKLDIAWAPAP